ncbi:MAG: N-acetylmuramoyl-L-alanine amidase CwlD [Desulfotomaculaceae bacterium]|nr:N-acetylmuramoyl-L-alanine amidase CwlD [Desulfotomaculaceae bacterium]MDD4766633.1 N-acetylmuramoyl-L-alanine amidase CwlD [Desulfotomaculaceae bacterium]
MLRTIKLKKSSVLILMLLLIIFLGCYKPLSTRYEEQYISTLSWVMANKLVVIDPGHGGVDPGALGSNSVLEKDIVLEVSMKLADIMRQSGAQVLLTRESDRDLSEPELNNLHKIKVQDLTRRVELANQNNADIFLSIHVNSFPDKRERGAQTFSQPGSEESKKLAMSIQKELNNFLENPGRQAKQVDYFANRMTKMPSVIVEIGFITNPGEEKLMLDPVYQNKIAWSIYAGTARYLADVRPAMTQAMLEP